LKEALWVTRFLFTETFRSFFAERFWSLKHFGHLSHNCIKTHRNSVFLPVFSNILTEIPQFFRSFRKRLGLCPIKKKQCATAGAGDLSRTADQFQPCLILRTGPQGHNECWPHANLLQLVSHHGTDSVRDLGLLCRNKMLQPRHGINFSKGRRPGVLPGM